MRRVGKCRTQYTRVEPSTVGERNVVYSGVREGGTCRNDRSRNCFVFSFCFVMVCNLENFFTVVLVYCDVLY